MAITEQEQLELDKYTQELIKKTIKNLDQAWHDIHNSIDDRSTAKAHIELAIKNLEEKLKATNH